MKKVAIITARSGSKGLKDKNILELGTVPLLCHSVNAALKSKLFNKVILSTDSEKYAQIGLSAGAEIIMRGDELSNDNATSYMVLKDFLERETEEFDYFVLLQPTSPFRTAEHIKEACLKFEQNFDRVDFLVSVCKASHPSVLIKPIDDDGLLKHFDTDFSSYKRQNSVEYYPNGAIYIAKPQAYLDKKHFFGERSLSYIMNDEDSVDIDSPLDYEFAKFLMQKRDN